MLTGVKIWVIYEPSGKKPEFKEKTLDSIAPVKILLCLIGFS